MDLVRTTKVITYMNSFFVGGNDIWENGILYNSIWNGMTFNDGLVKSSTWLDGVFNNGLFYSSNSFDGNIIDFFSNTLNIVKSQNGFRFIFKVHIGHLSHHFELLIFVQVI